MPDLDDADAPPVFISLTDRLRARAAERPQHVALIQDESVVSYGELDATTDRIAATLQAQGLRAQEVVAICASPSIAYVEVFCGALRAGLAVAPLAPSASAETLAAMVRDSGAKLLFVDRETAALFADDISPTQARQVRLDDDFRGWMVAEGAKPAAIAIEPNWTFNIIYSSGTTGAPKGIVQPHMMRTPLDPPGSPFGYGPHAVALISTGLYSNTTLVSLFPALGGGSTVVLMAKFEARRFLELAARWRVTHAMLVPVQYQRIMAVPDFDSFDLSAFVMKFCTSAPFSAALKADVLARWPGGLTEYYGMTEGGAGTVLYAHETPDKLHTVGKPWPHIDVRLIDDLGREVPLGEAGEVVGASALTMSGYHNQPEKTLEATWRDSEGRSYIRNGDIGRFDEDGFLILMDRKKDMIISGGFNVYPSDLEAMLSQHPAVAEAAVIGVPSEAWGETPVAFVVLKADVQVEAEDIRSWVNGRVGKVQRLSAVDVRTALPRSHIGKVLKRELRESYRPPTTV
ncbi:class I adenylate-forming enzyme family protein [Phenylobacterium sp.]|uniref:class I adenylate-forming enzyme family protein n=1 Tax=Phenylobacterium sp. TaxID=1871053 RepID=UPI00356AD65C